MQGLVLFGDASSIAKKNRSAAKPGMVRPGLSADRQVPQKEKFRAYFDPQWA
jgi:hypothetical protein